MKFVTFILFFVIIFGCTPKEVNTIKFKFRTEEVVNKDCKIAKEQKKISRRNDVTSKILLLIMPKLLIQIVRLNELVTLIDNSSIKNNNYIIKFTYEYH